MDESATILAAIPALAASPYPLHRAALLADVRTAHVLVTAAAAGNLDGATARADILRAAAYLRGRDTRRRFTRRAYWHYQGGANALAGDGERTAARRAVADYLRRLVCADAVKPHRRGR